MVKVGDICNFHVHTILLLRPCQVLTVSNMFILGSYYVPVTHASEVQQVLKTSLLCQRRWHHALTTFSLHPSSPYKYYYKCCTGPRRAVGNVCGYICVSDCRSRGREFDPGPVPYFRGDWSWNNFYGHSPPFRWFIQEGLLSVTSKSMCTNYWLTACSSLPRKKCG